MVCVQFQPVVAMVTRAYVCALAHISQPTRSRVASLEVKFSVESYTSQEDEQAPTEDMLALQALK